MPIVPKANPKDAVLLEEELTESLYIVRVSLLCVKACQRAVNWKLDGIT